MGRKARRGRKPPEQRGPSSEEIFERERAQRERCKAKQWFATESEARTIALMHRAQWGEDHVPYRCELCDGWHLASRKPPAGR